MRICKYKTVNDSKLTLTLSRIVQVFILHITETFSINNVLEKQFGDDGTILSIHVHNE